MTNSKSTKRALLTSALVVFMCVAMLIGTTFAWFTDTASTAVNKIQSGTLDVALEMKDADGNWVSAEGKTLSFVNLDGETDNLWEPGCTYELPELRIVNKGNLALKYKVVISGLDGDAKLNEAITWYYSIDLASTIFGGTGWTTPSERYLLEDFGQDDYLLPEGETGYRTHEQVFKIVGHMDEDAGNEYQGLTLDGIAITVLATQYTYEVDISGDQYDASAEYPEAPTTVATADALKDAIAAGEDIVLTDDIELTETVVITEDITIDGKGNTISGTPIRIQNTDSIVIKNVVFDGPDNANNNASNLCINSVKTIVIENCTFKNTQWDSVQITPVDGASITIKNCSFETSVAGAKRFIHIEVSNGAACTAQVEVNITNNTFGSSENLTEDIIGVYGVDENCINYGGNNTFADQDGVVWIGWAQNAYASNQADVYAKLAGN